MTASSSVLRMNRPTFVAATVSLILGCTGCGAHGTEPFVPTGTPSPTWSANLVTVSQSTVTFLAPTAASVGGRDELGTMHLVWGDGPVLRHGFVPLGDTQWSLRTIPTTTGATISAANIVYCAPGTFIASWIENRNDGFLRVLVSRSLDHGATWDPSLVVASAATVSGSVALYGFQRVAGGSGAVVAWADGNPLRVRASTWDGSGWNLSHWSSIATLSSNAAGSADDVVLGGRGE